MSEVRIAAPARLDQDHGVKLYEEVAAKNIGADQTVLLDFADTKDMDTLGGAWLMRLAEYVEKRGARLRWEGAEGDTAAFIELLGPSLEHAPPPPEKPPRLIENLGETAISVWKETGQFVDLSVDAAYWTLIAPFEGRGFRWGIFIDEMHEMGVRAVRIVCLMNFLLGLIIAMLSAKQVEAFGLSIYVADLIMIAFARELAAIMTAVVVSARTGAAISAEIATMKVQEEVDALRGMGLNVAQFLVAPKLLALVVVLPCLVALGMVSGIAGGAVWGVFVLDFQLDIWLTQTMNAAAFGDITQGMLKTFFFAVAIVMIGCHNGLRVSGGSRGVGLMTTRAVVMDIFMIIVIDIIFAVVFYYILE